MRNVFLLNQVVSISFHPSIKRDDLYTYSSYVKKRFLRKNVTIDCWDDGYPDFLSNKYLTDEELLNHFKDIGRKDMYIINKVLYQMSYIDIRLSDGQKIIKNFSDDNLAEYFYNRILEKITNKSDIYFDLKEFNY